MSGKLEVLLVDDEEELHVLLSPALQRRGNQGSDAGNGREALDALAMMGQLVYPRSR